MTLPLPRGGLCRSAFSLIELLVAMAVLAILAALMLSLTDSVLRLWRDRGNRAEALLEARAALDVMGRDLANCVALTNGVPTNAFFINGDGAFERLPAEAEKDASRAGAVLFHSALPANAQEAGQDSGDLCAVGYFLGFGRAPDSGTPALHLFRYFRSGDIAFGSVLDESVFSDVGTSPQEEEILARNILSFRVTPLVASNGAYSTNFVASPEAPHPDVIEISLTAIPREVAGRFVRREDWTLAPPEALLREGQTFTMRARLNPAPR